MRGAENSARWPEPSVGAGHGWKEREGGMVEPEHAELVSPGRSKASYKRVLASGVTGSDLPFYKNHSSSSVENGLEQGKAAGLGSNSGRR